MNFLLKYFYVIIKCSFYIFVGFSIFYDLQLFNNKNNFKTITKYKSLKICLNK